MTSAHTAWLVVMGKEPAAVLRMLSPLAPPFTALKAPGLQSER